MHPWPIVLAVLRYARDAADYRRFAPSSSGFLRLDLLTAEFPRVETLLLNEAGAKRAPRRRAVICSQYALFISEPCQSSGGSTENKVGSKDGVFVTEMLE